MKTKILVVGLLPGQARKVERECRNSAVDLRFVDGRHNGGLGGRADHCILMLKFVDHGHTNKALAQFPRDRVHYNRGGLTEVVATICGIAAGTVTHGAHRPVNYK